MITEKDLDVLYYITPIKYRTMLDGDFDPNAQENLEKEEKLEELLYKSSLNELIATIIKVFKKKYANPMPVWSSIVEYERNTKKKTQKEKILKI